MKNPMFRLSACAFAAVLAAAGLCGRSDASGRMAVAGGGEIRMISHKVEVAVDNQVAVTRIVQVFKNDTGRKVEAVYFFPVPEDANINRFVTWINGVMREGKIKEKAAARAAYEAAKSQGRKAVLLEDAGQGGFSVAISEIAPDAEQRIELEYMQILACDSGICEFTYPLVGRAASALPQEAFSFSMKIVSEVPISSVISNSHQIEKEVAPGRVSVKFSASAFKPEKNLHLAYALRRDDTGIDIVASRKGGEGYFLAMITPKSELSASDIIAKDVIFVIDTSGSMEGIKIELAKKALLYCVRTLNRKDRFDIVHFNYYAHAFKGELMHPTLENTESARAFVERLGANGGTNIDAALRMALEANQAGDRPFFVVFITDGMPTQGEINQDRIIENARSRLKDNARIFNFGIGRDLNFFLLRQLARRSRGTAEFVPEEHELEARISAFQAKISMPVLSDLKLDMGAANASAVYPNDVSYLFAGEQVMVLGRYANPGKATVVLSGKKGADVLKFEKTFDFPETDESRPHLPKLWAMKKIKMLLDEIALKGENPELRTEVLDLGLAFGIATPYTSFLVEELSEETVSAPEKLEKERQDAPSGGGLARSKSGGGYAKRAGAAPGQPAPSGGPPTGGPAPGPTPSPTPSPTPTPTPNPAPPSTQGSPAKDKKADGAETRRAVEEKSSKPGTADTAAAIAAWLAKDGRTVSRDNAETVSLALIALAEAGNSREWGRHSAVFAAALDSLAAAAPESAGGIAPLLAACAFASSCAETQTDKDVKSLAAILSALAADAKALSGDESVGWCSYLAWKARKAGAKIPEAVSGAIKAGLESENPGPGILAAAVFAGADSPKAPREKLDSMADSIKKGGGEAYAFFATVAAFKAGEDAFGAFCASIADSLNSGQIQEGEGRGLWKADSPQASVRASSLRMLALTAGYMLKQGTVK